MSGKKGGQGRGKHGGNAKQGSKSIYVPKSADASRAASSGGGGRGGRKGGSRADEVTVMQDVEAPEIAALQKNRSKAVSAIAAIAAARESHNNTSKRTTKSPRLGNTDASKTSDVNSEVSNAKATAAPKTAQQIAIDFRQRSAGKRAALQSPKVTSAGTAAQTFSTQTTNASSAPDAANQASIFASSSGSMDLDANNDATTQNPKKRKAPETERDKADEPGTQKRRSELAPSWKVPINTTDPTKMTIGEIELEIQTVKNSITTLKELIRLEKFKTPLSAQVAH